MCFLWRQRYTHHSKLLQSHFAVILTKLSIFVFVASKTTPLTVLCFSRHKSLTVTLKASISIPGRRRRRVTDTGHTSPSPERRAARVWPGPLHRRWRLGLRDRRELRLRVGTRPRARRRGRQGIRWRRPRGWRGLRPDHRRPHNHYRATRSPGNPDHRTSVPTNRHRCSQSWVVAAACPVSFAFLLSFAREFVDIWTVGLFLTIRAIRC